MFLNAFQATLKKKIIDILHITCGTEFLSLIMFKYVSNIECCKTIPQFLLPTLWSQGCVLGLFMLKSSTVSSIMEKYALLNLIRQFLSN